MKQKTKYFEVLDTANGSDGVYKGGQNWSYDPIKCDNCDGEMLKLPTNVPYLKFKTGCLIINVRNGIMYVDNSTPNFVYTCSKCANAKSINWDGE